MKNTIRDLNLTEINSVSGGPDYGPGYTPPLNPLPPSPSPPPPGPEIEEPEPVVVTREELQE